MSGDECESGGRLAMFLCRYCTWVEHGPKGVTRTRILGWKTSSNVIEVKYTGRGSLTLYLTKGTLTLNLASVKLDQLQYTCGTALEILSSVRAQ